MPDLVADFKRLRLYGMAAATRKAWSRASRT